MTRPGMAWVALLFSVCVWDFAAAGMLEMRCANVEEGKKVTIPSSAEILQDACQLEISVTPFKEGDLQFLFGISGLTQFITREDIDSLAYKGVPKVFQLFNVTETFNATEVGTARTLSVGDIALDPVRSGLGGQCGNVYLLAGLDTGAEMDGTSVGAILQCPDETGVDLVAVVSTDMERTQTTEHGPEGAHFLLEAAADTIPIQIRIENRGSATLAARTDPDALKVWVHLGQTHALQALNYSSPHRSLVPEMVGHKMHLPHAGDPLLSSENLFPQDFPGSPEIPPGGSVTLDLTQLRLPDNICDAMLLIVNVDPIGEVRDSNVSNNVVGYGIHRMCPPAVPSRCSLYRSAGTSARALVTLKQSGWEHNSNMIEYDILSGGVSTLDIHNPDPAHQTNVMRSVITSHAVEAEVERLKSIGCCNPEAEDEPERWEDSMVGRLGSSLASIRQSLSAVVAESDWEEKQLDLMALMVETIGQLMVQPGSLRTIFSTVLHAPNTISPGPGGSTDWSGENWPGAGGHGDGAWGGGNWPGTTTAYSSWDYSSGGYSSGGYSSGGYSSGGYSSGYYSYGDYSWGDRSSGDYSSGYYSSGDYSWGDRSSGDYSSGYYSSGDYSSGDYSSGGYSSGGYSSGDYSSGGYSSGDYSWGDRSSGDYSSGGYSSGVYSWGDRSSGDYSSGGSSYSVGSGQYSESSGLSSYSSYSDYRSSESSSGDFYSSSFYSYGESWFYSDSSAYDGSSYNTFSAETLQASTRRKRSHYDTNTYMDRPAFYDSEQDPGQNQANPWQQGFNPGATNGVPGAMGGMPGGTCHGWERDCVSPVMVRVHAVGSRLEKLLEEIGRGLMTGGYQYVRLPGQLHGQLTDNFRRFLKELLWEGDVTQIPGYEMVDPAFVSNARRVVDEIQRMVGAQEKPVWFDDDSYPENFTRHMEEWAKSQSINPSRPLPAGLLESALRQVAAAPSDFTSHDWEENQDIKNATVKLLAKTARALLGTRREEVLDKFENAVRELHRQLATEGVPHGEPGEGPTTHAKIRRMVEESLRKDDRAMGPMLLERDGGIYTVERSPLTNDYLWTKVVACTCDPDPVSCQP